MADPDRILKERLREDRKLEKLKNRLEKRYKDGKIDKEAYINELHKIGYVTQKELVEDFKKMIQDEISFLENLDTKGTASAGGQTTAQDGSARSDRMTDSTPQPPPPPPPPPRPPRAYGYDTRRNDEEEEEEENIEEIPEEMAEWELDEDAAALEPEDYHEQEATEDREAEGYENDEVPMEERQEMEPEEDRKEDTDTIKIDRRTGVIEYDRIKMIDLSDAQVMEGYEDAVVMDEEARKRKKAKAVKKPSGPKREAPKEGAEVSAAERLIREMERTPSEALNLDEVLIPDIDSTLKSRDGKSATGRAAPAIMWEADEEDRLWLQKQFQSRIDDLRARHLAWQKWRQELKAKAKALELNRRAGEAEDWVLVRRTRKRIIAGKGADKKDRYREVWVVKVRKKDEERKKEEPRHEEPKKEERMKEERKHKEQKREERKREDRPSRGKGKAKPESTDDELDDEIMWD